MLYIDPIAISSLCIHVSTDELSDSLVGCLVGWMWLEGLHLLEAWSPSAPWEQLDWFCGCSCSSGSASNWPCVTCRRIHLKYQGWHAGYDVAIFYGRIRQITKLLLALQHLVLSRMNQSASEQQDHLCHFGLCLDVPMANMATRHSIPCLTVCRGCKSLHKKVSL